MKWPEAAWSEFHARLHRTLKQRSLLPPNQPCLLAVSGGQDSLSLLKLLLDLQPKWGWQLTIAHCDHGWPTDEGIAEHVAALAQAAHVPYSLATASPGLAETEAAARHWRYKALTRLAQDDNFPVIVTAHTQSDRAETLLHNLIRGAGADGLQALTWQRPLTPEIQLVRPLLGFTRAETKEICDRYQLPIWDDVLNQSRRYARNRLRLEIIPQLQADFNPQVEQALANTAELLQADVDYLEQQAQVLYDQHYDPVQQRVALRVLQPLHRALQRRLIRRLLQQVLPGMPT
ncbi:MAG: tRNA lysidine(34) synthetase TilS, partial [Spirulina sp. SIO3F2]|nr:tRNA lysidine(34) synthetase TilS [Spirulina sp. SIO3F2]